MPEVVRLIPSRIKNAAVGGHVAGAVDIVDDSLNQDQEVLNAVFHATSTDFQNFAAIMMIALNYGYDASTATNPEWKYIILDSEDRILAGVKVDNTVFVANILNN